MKPINQPAANQAAQLYSAKASRFKGRGHLLLRGRLVLAHFTQAVGPLDMAAIVHACNTSAANEAKIAALVEVLKEQVAWSTGINSERANKLRAALALAKV